MESFQYQSPDGSYGHQQLTGPGYQEQSGPGWQQRQSVHTEIIGMPQQQPPPPAPAPAPQPIVMNNVVSQQQQSGGGGVVVVNQAQPSDCMACSILNLIFCNLILGIIATVFSCMARESLDNGDIDSGRSYAKVAKIINIISPLLTVIIVIAIIAWWFTAAAAAVRSIG